MKIKSIILLSALLITISPQCIHAGDKDSPLIGEWVSTTGSKGGLGGSKYYRTDGTVIVTYGALVDYQYKIKDNLLSLYNEKGELSFENEYKINGSDLVLKEIKTGKEQKLKRVEGDLTPSIIGKWVGSNDTGAKYCMHFTKGLNCYFSVPMDQVKGQYKFVGNKSIEEFSEIGKTEWIIRIEGDSLTLLENGNSKIEEYRKKK
jgi:hypothetical protein